ncbi:MAG: diguanylate cyclase [Oscillatoriales cyanobacterium RM2_1_1]|nr:diguanylate cyclase [Oscillatoriales cyanobacterium SM2_3_0]NJO48013.1 diguanylate cyclase [Oscillatoriales cyanobacterium RM2_1_1]
MGKPIILCVDDERTILDSLKVELRSAVGSRCILETAEGGQEALELIDELQENQIDIAVVVSDYIMPGMRGDELLRQIHQRSPKTLKVLLTGQADLPAIGNAIRYAKLYRYIPKPWESEDLKLTVVEALNSYYQDQELQEKNLRLQQVNQELQQMTHKLRQANLELQKLAITDSLTQLANRRQFDTFLTHEWLRMMREKQFLSLIFCDVDFFKGYNDQYGHPQGDICLHKVAQTIRSTAKRPGDLTARYGGEEFVVILPNTPAEGALIVAEAVRAAVVALKISHGNSSICEFVTLSLGVSSVIPSPDYAPEDLVSAADQALYEAKRFGRNRTVFKPLVSPST